MPEGGESGIGVKQTIVIGVTAAVIACAIILVLDRLQVHRLFREVESVLRDASTRRIDINERHDAGGSAGSGGTIGNEFGESGNPGSGEPGEGSGGGKADDGDLGVEDGG